MKIGLQTWGSEGDVQPFTALAAGLVSAGHEVTLVVTDISGRDYSALAQRCGYRLVNVRNPALPAGNEKEKLWREITAVRHPLRQVELIVKHGFDPVLEPMFQAAGDLCAGSDAVVGHFFVYPLRVAAEKAGLPLATVNLVHNCLPSAHTCPRGLPNLGRWMYPLAWKLVRRMVNRTFLPRVNALRRREGLAPDRDVVTQTWASGKLNLIAVSPTICQAAPDWDPRHQVCGFLDPLAGLSAEEPPAGLEAFLAAGERPVYFTFGSMLIPNLSYLKEAADLWMATVRRVGCRAVFQLPWDDLSAFDSDDRVFKVQRSPYKRVFPECAVVVHHGGAGTTQSALLAGRPSVIVAHLADQGFWGAELERLGVAGPTQRRKGLSAKRLATAIARVLARPEMAQRAAAVGAAMSQERGVETAIRLIESRLGCGKSSLSRLAPRHSR